MNPSPHDNTTTGGGGAANKNNSNIQIPRQLPEQIPRSIPKDSIFHIIMSQKTGAVKPDGHYSPELALHRPVPKRDYNDVYHIDTLTRQALPYFLPWKPTAGPNEVPPSFDWLTNSCGGKAAIGVFGGGMMGLLMGVFLGAMSDTAPPVQVIAGKEVPQAPMKEQLRVVFRATADKSLYWCKNFAFLSGVFGGTDCLVEKYRGKHDVWNSVASGCITGAALQARQGPQAAAIGCGGFAVFSLGIEQIMGHY